MREPPSALSPPGDTSLGYRMREPPSTLDPVRAGDNNSLMYVYLLFDGLVEFAPGSLEVRPALAKSWDVSADGRVYTFHLRDGIMFHNGRPITASDVVYSIRRGLSQAAHSEKHDFLAPLLGSGPFWDGATLELPGVAAPDPRTVVLTLSEPYPPFLSVLASEAGSIVPHEVYSDPDQGFLRHPVGSGPYTLQAWEPDISITLARFKQHWKPAPAAGIDTISVRFIRDASTALEEYRAGNIDFTYELPPGQRRRIQEELPEAFHHGQQMWLFYVGFNHASGPFRSNPTLRRAVARAVDSDYIVRQLQEGKDRIATGVIPPGMMGFGETAAPFPYDLDEARRLMAQAGYPGGKGFPEIVYLSNETQGFRRIAERLRTDLARIGITMRVKMMDFGAFLQELNSHDPSGPDASLFRMTWYPDWPDPDNFLGVQFRTGGAGNFGRYSNPAFDALMEKARHEIDADARRDLYRRADAMLIDDVALVPVYWYGQDILLRPTFTGLKISPLGAFATAWEEMETAR